MRIAQRTCLCLLVALAGCGGGGGSGTNPPANDPVAAPPPPATTGLARGGEPIGTYSYLQPEASGDGWATAHLADSGLNESTIQDMMQRVVDGDFGPIHGIVIARDGALVLEEYFDGRFEGALTQWNADALHRVNSVTKSFASAASLLASR